MSQWDGVWGPEVSIYNICSEWDPCWANVVQLSLKLYQLMVASMACL